MATTLTYHACAGEGASSCVNDPGPARHRHDGADPAALRDRDDAARAGSAGPSGIVTMTPPTNPAQALLDRQPH